MKRILIAAAAVLMAACQPMPASDGPTEIAAIVPAGQTVIGPSVAGSEDAAACARAGGKIMTMREEDLPEVREESFRYPGPRPQTREGAIISLADSIESASRSLERVTPHKIDQLISDIIQQRLVDGQLKECDLTMRELEEVAESFKHTLQSMMHTRVSYPGGRTEKSDRTERRDTPVPAPRASEPPASAA